MVQFKNGWHTSTIMTEMVCLACQGHRWTQHDWWYWIWQIEKQQFKAAHSTITRKWQGLFLNGCKWKSLIYMIREFLKLRHRWVKCINVLRGRKLKSNTSVENMSYNKYCNHFSFSCYGLWNLKDWRSFEF